MLRLLRPRMVAATAVDEDAVEDVEDEDMVAGVDTTEAHKAKMARTSTRRVTDVGASDTSRRIAVLLKVPNPRRKIRLTRPRTVRRRTTRNQTGKQLSPQLQQILPRRILHQWLVVRISRKSTTLGAL